MTIWAHGMIYLMGLYRKRLPFPLEITLVNQKYILQFKKIQKLKTKQKLHMTFKLTRRIIRKSINFNGVTIKIRKISLPEKSTIVYYIVSLLFYFFIFCCRLCIICHGQHNHLTRARKQISTEKKTLKIAKPKRRVPLRLRSEYIIKTFHNFTKTPTNSVIYKQKN